MAKRRPAVEKLARRVAIRFSTLCTYIEIDLAALLMASAVIGLVLAALFLGSIIAALLVIVVIIVSMVVAIKALVRHVSRIRDRRRQYVAREC